MIIMVIKLILLALFYWWVNRGAERLSKKDKEFLWWHYSLMTNLREPKRKRISEFKNRFMIFTQIEKEVEKKGKMITTTATTNPRTSQDLWENIKWSSIHVL